ncbi:hypothetical protein ACF6AA_003870 [Escherichia coli]
MSRKYLEPVIRDESIQFQENNNSKLANTIINNSIFGICIIAVSFRVLIIAVIMLAACALWSLLTLKASMKTFAMMGGILLFLCLYYFLGLSHYERGPEKFTNAFSLILFSFVFFFILGYKETVEGRIKWLNFFSLCSIIYVITVCIYSILKGYPGYNLVYDPINRSEENSPLYALQLVLFSIAYVNFNWSKQRRFFNIALILIATFFSVLYLGSRAAFFLIIIFFTLKIITRKHSLLLFFVLIIMAALIIMNFASDLNITNSFNFGGFSERGLDSPRFSMFIYGISNFLDYPFGGLKVHAEGYTGIWFHNMLLDLVRVSGYYVMFLWLIILIVTTCFLMKFNDKKYIILFIIVNVAFMQDLAFDGFFNLMALEFYLIGASLVKAQKFNV